MQLFSGINLLGLDCLLRAYIMCLIRPHLLGSINFISAQNQKLLTRRVSMSSNTRVSFLNQVGGQTIRGQKEKRKKWKCLTHSQKCYVLL